MLAVPHPCASAARCARKVTSPSRSCRPCDLHPAPEQGRRALWRFPGTAAPSTALPGPSPAEPVPAPLPKHWFLVFWAQATLTGAVKGPGGKVG